ncbi:hypothetical protein [uncultured Eudoraea sp.]|uniref:hypothetical protein n=1 Tax=uncultured Eudoraea sp. TaxID=1035614 RepID=UPI00260CFC4A|nr:hypothetical protein [uncultured Eudoraea sp.]
MEASEKLLSARILTVVLSTLLIAVVILFYKEYVPELLLKAEHAIAASMGNIDSTVAAR